MKHRLNGDAAAAMPHGPLRLLFDNLGIVSYYLNAVVLPLAERHKLSARGIWVLRFIADGDVNPGAIATSMMVAPSITTGDVQRLIAAGLVNRAPDPADGRRICLGLTDKGRTLLDEAYALYESRVLRRLLAYPPGELDIFFKVLTELSRERWDGSAPGALPAESQDDGERLRSENRMLRTLLAESWRRSEPQA